MDNNVELTDDDESFEEITKPVDTITIISSDSDAATDHYLSSDDEIPAVNLAIQEKKRALIKKLFPASEKNDDNQPTPNSSCNLKDFTREPPPALPFAAPKKIREPGINRMIEGVNVNLPVNPYGCQVALMSMVIYCFLLQC